MVQQKGFTLVEVMIVVVIISILAAIALPMQADHQMKARRAVAKGLMMDVQSKQENFFIDWKSYAPDLAVLRYAAPTLNIDDNARSVLVDEAYYTISMVADSISYTITAQPINRQAKDECGVLTLNNVGQKLPPNCW